MVLIVQSDKLKYHALSSFDIDHWRLQIPNSFQSVSKSVVFNQLNNFTGADKTYLINQEPFKSYGTHVAACGKNE